MVESLRPTQVSQPVGTHNESNQNQSEGQVQAQAPAMTTQTQMQMQQVQDQERFLPIANINRIMKNALPSDTKISKEARECVQECVSEFIAFITCESCEITQVEKRKTINGEDVIKAMENLNFVDYLDLVEFYNKRYKEVLKKNDGKDLEIGSDVMS